MKHMLPAALLLLLAGCAVTRPEPSINPQTLDRDSFWSWLADQPMVSTAEAYRAMLIAATDADPGSDFTQNEQAVFQRQIARPQWRLAPNQAIDKATAAFMAVQVAHLPGGINLNLWGRTLHLGDRRYAFREVLFEGVRWDEHAAYQVITGGEFVALLTWMDQQRDKDSSAEMPRPAAGAVAPTTQPEVAQ